MFIASFPAGPWQTNCYLVAPQAGSPCVVVDPGPESLGRLREVTAEHGLTPVAVLLTHGHLDHTFSVEFVCEETGAECWIHPKDRAQLTDPMSGLPADWSAMVAGLSPGRGFREPGVVHELADGATVSAAGLDFTARHAPGHTPGSTMFRLDYPADDQIDSLLFSGDVLFAGSIGRTDLPGGSHADMLDSLRRQVAPLPDSVVVLPGHGPSTTLGQERTSNPYRSQL